VVGFFGVFGCLGLGGAGSCGVFFLFCVGWFFFWFLNLRFFEPSLHPIDAVMQSSFLIPSSKDEKT